MRTILTSGVLALTLGLGACDYIPESVQRTIDGWLETNQEKVVKGEFQGDLVVRFFSGKSGDGQPVELIMLQEPFGYKDSNGLEWEVPPGYISNGASIPGPLWTVVGGPFSGPYRDAAVIHDYHCELQERPWQKVHEMFLEAAISRGTEPSLAKTMYAAILLAGPRWGQERAALERLPLVQVQATRSNSSSYFSKVVSKDDKIPFETEGKSPEEIFAALQQWIKREKPNKEEIQRMVEKLRKITIKKSR